MQKYGLEVDSKDAWAELTAEYTAALDGAYHRHRLEVIRSLIPASLFAPGQRVLDFGCGDAVLFPPFLQAGAQISGLDIAPEMITAAKQRLGSNVQASLGGVAELAQVATASLDGLLSFNVLAYLTDEEDREFYRQARRIVKPGGCLVVTHSNELFDMFSLNRFTVEFFERNFGARVGTLLASPESPASRVTYNVRENPLAYRHKLSSHGFHEKVQRFINHHPAPPLQLEGERTYADTLNVADAQQWRLLFTCSTFGSCAMRA